MSMKTIGTLLGLCLITGCSMQRMSLNMTAPLLRDSLPAFEQESDFELARQALPATIKTVEGFLRSGPDNQDLLLLLAKAYGAYAMYFLEDELGQTEDGSDERYALALRVKTMYLRSHEYAMKMLEERRSGFGAAFKAGGKKLKQALADCDKDDVAPIFWAGMALGSAINQARDDAAMIYMVPQAKAMVERALELDETYYFAGPHLVLGVILGGMPAALGGNPKQGKEHFERALKLTQRKAPLIHVMYAEYAAVQLQDRGLFKKLLNEVLKASVEINPDQQLMTVAAKRRASRLLAKMDLLF